MTDTILPMMRSHTYFRGLSDEILSEVAGHLEERRYDTGELVHRPEQLVTTVGFLVAGRVKAVIAGPGGQ